MENKSLSRNNRRCFECRFGFTTFDDEIGEYRCKKLGGKKAEEINDGDCPRPRIDAIEKMMREMEADL